MAAKLVVAPEAEQDLCEAYAWYEEQRAGLGEDFLSSIDACIQRIRRNPDIYEIVHESYRRALVRRFPYAVFFDYSDDTVTVYCIFQTARDPEKWRRRLR
jgi:plasmid stabilization system protein ParE